ncbi:MAG TPA: hypothetical protein VM053_11975 [Gemmatimonadaceae bacterium]|nr:hypothetical protein [Gemmatimonadaceae bacterium]
MHLRLAVAVLVVTTVGGCKTEAPPALVMRSDVGVCEHVKDAPVIELPADGSYHLNHASLTRAQLEKRMTSGESLPLGPHTGTTKGTTLASDRLVVVRFDSTRGRELSWIIPAVNKIGGEVVSPPLCPSESPPSTNN